MKSQVGKIVPLAFSSMLGLLAASPASAALLTYHMSGTHTDVNPALSGTVNATMTVESTDNSIAFAFSDPAYLFPIRSYSVSIVGSPYGLTNPGDITAYYIQAGNHLNIIEGSGFDFRFNGSNGSADFLFPTAALTPANIGTIQPAPALAGTLAFQNYSISTSDYFQFPANLVVPEPTTLALLAAGTMVMRRRRA